MVAHQEEGMDSDGVAGAGFAEQFAVVVTV